VRVRAVARLEKAMSEKEGKTMYSPSRERVMRFRIISVMSERRRFDGDRGLKRNLKTRPRCAQAERLRKFSRLRQLVNVNGETSASLSEEKPRSGSIKVTIVRERKRSVTGERARQCLTRAFHLGADPKSSRL